VPRCRPAPQRWGAPGGTGRNYTVRGYVDAENSFGASIRSQYTCEIHGNGNGNWTLVSLTGLN
jgi:hypothetical protein